MSRYEKKINNLKIWKIIQFSSTRLRYSWKFSRIILEFPNGMITKGYFQIEFFKLGLLLPLHFISRSGTSHYKTAISSHSDRKELNWKTLLFLSIEPTLIVSSPYWFSPCIQLGPFYTWTLPTCVWKLGRNIHKTRIGLTESLTEVING